MKDALKALLRPGWRLVKSGLTRSSRLVGRLVPSYARARARRRTDLRFVRYGSSGLWIAVSSPPVSPEIIRIVKSGHYEAAEAALVPALLDADEVVLELGSGLGIMSSLVMASGRARAVHCFEADERLIPLIRATHDRNGITASTLYNRIITSDPAALQRGHADIHLHRHFMANSMTPPRRGRARPVSRVPTADFAGVLATVRPTVIIADIEGAELGLFAGQDLSSVARVFLELHPKVTGAAGIREVFEDLHKAGFAFDPATSSGAVAGFVRV